MYRNKGVLQVRQRSSKPKSGRLPAKTKSEILISARTTSEGDERLQKRRTELDDVALEISQEINRHEEATSGGDVVHKVKGIKKGKKKKKKKTPEPIKFDFRKFKFVEEVDDKYVMEYALTPDEIMNYRKNHFQIERVPKIEVRETKSSELKEEFGTYCGVKKTIKNWLYWT